MEDNWSTILAGTGLRDRDLWYIRHCGIRYTSVKKIILFGSRAAGTYRPDSDIDLGLIGHEIDSSTANFIKWDLEEVYPIPYQFDIIRLDDIATSAALVTKAHDEGRVLYDASIDKAPLPPEPGMLHSAHSLQALCRVGLWSSASPRRYAVLATKALNEGRVLQF